jgi:hypothetical protein
MKRAIIIGILILVLNGCEDERKPEKSAAPEQAKTAAPIVLNKDTVLLPGQESVLRQCENILDTFHKEGVSNAFNIIRKLSPLPAAELDKLEEIANQQLASVGPRFGKIIGYEKISVTIKGSSVLECVYITKYENHLLRWRFYFYKPNEKWFLNSFYWDDKIHEL